MRFSLYEIYNAQRYTHWYACHNLLEPVWLTCGSHKANLEVPRAVDREYSHKADQRLATRYSDPQLMFGDSEWLEIYAGAL